MRHFYLYFLALTFLALTLNCNRRRLQKEISVKMPRPRASLSLDESTYKYVPLLFEMKMTQVDQTVSYYDLERNEDYPYTVSDKNLKIESWFAMFTIHKDAADNKDTEGRYLYCPEANQSSLATYEDSSLLLVCNEAIYSYNFHQIEIKEVGNFLILLSQEVD